MERFPSRKGGRLVGATGRWLGGAKAEYPVRPICPPETRRAFSIGDGLVRISIGIEEANDLIEDVDRALSQA